MYEKNKEISEIPRVFQKPLKIIVQRIAVFVGCTTMVLLGFLARPAKADPILEFSDTLSNQTMSQATNHTFSLLMGAAAAEGSTIVFTFASSFDITTITAGDIDFTVLGVNRTLASNCAGVNELSAVVSSGTLTFTVCPGNGGTVPISSSVLVKIGTHASFGGAGINQIINPVAAGSHLISLGGTFGGRNAVSIVISDPSAVTVSGTVISGGSGGGNNSGGSGDVTPPVISNIVVHSIAQTSAVVSWDTNEDSDSMVDYGRTADYELGTVSDVNVTKIHSISLTGLTIGTLYHLRVRSKDVAKNQATSTDVTFTTLAGPDVAAPIISDIEVINITGVGGQVHWITNEISSSWVDYGRTVGYELGHVNNPALVLNHTLSIGGLASQTAYHYRVISVDGSGNIATSADKTFFTLDVTPPIISLLVVGDITTTTARITWTTNESSTSTVSYGVTNAFEEGDVTTAGNVVKHDVSLIGLHPTTTYRFRVGSADVSGNLATQVGVPFKTLADHTPPTNVSEFIARETGPGVVTLTWKNPVDADFSGVRIVSRTDRLPLNQNDGLILANTPAQTALDPGRTAGVTYRYGAFAFDNAGNFSSGVVTQVLISAICGDARCTVPETPNSCPVDCKALLSPLCGNRVCENGETNKNCPADCGVVVIPPSSCGNFICENGETFDTCPADCKNKPLSVCGNAICEADETNKNCPADCASILLPEGNAQKLTVADPHFLAANGRIEFIPKGITFTAIARDVMRVDVNDTSFSVAPLSVRLGIGGSITQFAHTNGAYSGTVLLPGEGLVPAYLSVVYPNGSADRIAFDIETVSRGKVMISIGKEVRPAVGALVTLRTADGNVWDGASFGQENPVRTGSDGTFAWYVPNGTYQVTADMSSFQSAKKTIVVLNGVAATEIILISLPPALIEMAKSIFSSNASLGHKVLALGDLAGLGFDTASTVLRTDILDNPKVEDFAVTVATPTLVVVSTVSAGAAALAVGLGNVIQFVFLQPVVYLSRRKRKAWGVVYNAITKVPVGLAVVRLYDASTNRLLQTRVTDREGRYFFIASLGHYRLEATKEGFVWPSVYLKNATTDVNFVDVYHGENVEVTAVDATISANIPLDPKVPERTPASIIRQRVLRKLEELISIVSLIVAMVIIVITPTVLTITLLAVQVVFYIFTRVFVHLRKPPGWGIVYDAATRTPLVHAIVRLFEPVYGKLIEATVTDTHGRYSFLAGANQYRVAAQKEGYKNKSVDLDYRSKKEPEPVHEHLSLDPVGDAEWKTEPITDVQK